MTTARQLALLTLRRVHRGAFAAPALDAALRDSHLLGQERSFVTDLVYGTLRYEIAIDASLAPRLKRPDKLPDEVRDALRLGSYELLYRKTPRHAAVHEWVEVIKQHQRSFAGLVNAVLRRVETPADLSDAERVGVPAWLYQDWQTRFGTRAAEVAQGMLEPAPLWLMSYHNGATESLEDEGCEVTPGPLAGTLAVRAPVPLAALTAFKRGWVQPQNPCSSLPARLLAPQAGERVLDLCSGNGVKAAQLAAAGAQVESIELSEKKVARAEQNLRRLGLRASTLVHDLRHVPDVVPAAKVLLDAPCSGTGTLRGHPELRTRVTQDAVAELATLQAELLTTAAALTAPGGTLVYAVCALTTAEGVAVVEHFLENNAFEVTPWPTDLPHITHQEGTYLLPLEGLDGFFVTRLGRTNTIIEDKRV